MQVYLLCTYCTHRPLAYHCPDRHGQNNRAMSMQPLGYDNTPPPTWVNTLHHGDCLEVLPQIPDHSVNLICVDLPYGVTNNAWDTVLPMDVLWAEYKRLLAPRGNVVLTAQGLFSARLICSNERWYRYKLTWAKRYPGGFFASRSASPCNYRGYPNICS